MHEEYLASMLLLLLLLQLQLLLLLLHAAAPDIFLRG
jgi:hypothetical protein